MKAANKYVIPIFLILIFLLVIFGLFYSKNSKQTKAVKANNLNSKQVKLPDGRSFTYSQFKTANGELRYVFDTSIVAPQVTGFNGPVPMRLTIDKLGNIKDCVILQNRETPAYLGKAEKDRSKFLSRNIFSTFNKNKIYTVTGATYSSRGIDEGHWISGNIFAKYVLNKNLPGQSVKQSSSTVSSKGIIFFIVFIIWAIIVFICRFKINRLLRFVLLCMTFFLYAIFFQIQFSSQSAVSLIFFDVPANIFSVSFITIVLVVATVFVFGNFYCGYLCPFGALQELTNNLNYKGNNIAPEKKIWGFIRLTKYVVFLAILFLFVISNQNQLAFNGDLLTGVLSPFTATQFQIILIVGILFISLFTRRFWCRNLCPAGAFLSIFNKINLLKFIIKRKKMMKRLPISPGFCDLGISTFEDNDCINCDRCRLNKINKKGK